MCELTQLSEDFIGDDAEFGDMLSSGNNLNDGDDLIGEDSIFQDLIGHGNLKTRGNFGLDNIGNAHGDGPSMDYNGHTHGDGPLMDNNGLHGLHGQPSGVTAPSAVTIVGGPGAEPYMDGNKDYAVLNLNQGVNNTERMEDTPLLTKSKQWSRNGTCRNHDARNTPTVPTPYPRGRLVQPRTLNPELLLASRRTPTKGKI